MKARPLRPRAQEASPAAYPARPTKPAKLGGTPDAPIPVGRLPEPVRRCLEPLNKEVWLTGTIRDFRSTGGGHLFFSLVEGGATLQCVVWRDHATAICPRFSRHKNATPIAMGDAVVAFGRLSLDPGRVTLRCVVTRLERQGRSIAATSRERTLEALRRDGLLDDARKRRLPVLPRGIALITSAGSAAQHDVITAAHSRYPGLRIELVPALVQGTGASESLQAAIEVAANIDGCEVLLICRGGGSAADLSAFDDEDVVRAIARCPIPVVTGIGHQTDISLADWVADVRASTPTAAAAAAVPLRAELEAELDRMRESLMRATSLRLGRERSAVARMANAMGGAVTLRIERAKRGRERLDRDLRSALRAWMSVTRDSLERVHTAVQHRVEVVLGSRRTNIELLAARLRPLDPEAILARGYAIARSTDGLVLGSAADFGDGSRFVLRLCDGEIEARVVPSFAGPGRDRLHNPEQEAPCRTNR